MHTEATAHRQALDYWGIGDIDQPIGIVLFRAGGTSARTTEMARTNQQPRVHRRLPDRLRNSDAPLGRPAGAPFCLRCRVTQLFSDMLRVLRHATHERCDMETVVPLTEWREHMGMSQAQLARALGVARSTILRWESGQYPIEHPTTLRLALERLEETVQTYYVAFSQLGNTFPFLARGDDPESAKQAAYAQIDKWFPRNSANNATLRKNLNVSPRSRIRLEDVVPK